MEINTSESASTLVRGSRCVPRDTSKRPDGASAPRVRRSLRYLWSRFRWLLYVLRISLRSLRGHIVELMPRRNSLVDLGPWYHRETDGSLLRDTRTEYRNAGTESVSLSHPWASTLEWEIFLDGFVWGERFARGNPLDTRPNNEITGHAASEQSINTLSNRSI
jgi:hypothetical protein